MIFLLYYNINHGKSWMIQSKLMDKEDQVEEMNQNLVEHNLILIENLLLKKSNK